MIENKEPYTYLTNSFGGLDLWYIISSKQFHNNIHWRNRFTVEEHRDAFINLFKTHEQYLLSRTNESINAFQSALATLAKMCKAEVRYLSQIKVVELYQTSCVQRKTEENFNRQVIYLPLIDRNLYHEIKESNSYTNI